MPLEDLPEKIKDEIQNRSMYEQRENQINTTELIYCIRKAYYRRKFPKPPSLKSAWWMWRGNVFDRVFTPLFERHQERVTHRVRGTPIIISGRIDFIEDDTVYELKTTNNLKYIQKDGPHKDHLKQVKFYTWCNAYQKAKIIYMDLNDVLVFDVDLSDLDEVIDEFEDVARKLYNAILLDEPPEKNAQKWECNYCTYKDMCKNDTADK